MPPPTESRPPRPPDPAATVGDIAVEASLGTDALGEVCRGRREGVEVRLRLVRPADRDALTARLEGVGAIRHPAVAPVRAVLADGSGRVAVVGTADHLTLHRRVRSGPIDAITAAGLGAVLLDGLAALHAAGLHHGAPEATTVGIDAAGRAWWQDAGVADPRPVAPGTADLARAAAMLRRAGGLPPALATLVDDVASGVPGAPATATELAVEWRALAVAAGLPVSPTDTPATLRGLLEPPPRPVRRRRPEIGRRLRPVAALALALLALGLLPAARLAPGGRPPFAALADYRPAASARHLHYSVRQVTNVGTATATAALHVGDDTTVGGIPTLTLLPDAAAPAVLPLGLSGTTLRVQDAALERSVAGGLVRDLVEPLAPGTGWSDRHATSGGFVTTEDRMLLGPTTLDEPVGHLDRCAVVGLRISTSETATGTAGATATATLWYCPGIGLARAQIDSAGERDVIDLVAAS